MTETVFLSPEEVRDRLVSVVGEEAVTNIRVTSWAEGTKGATSRAVWLTIPRERFMMAVRALADIELPHLGVISGVDTGDEIELLYHFYIYGGHHHKEILVTLTVALPKDDLTIPTITGILPGALISEREKQEMLGITVVDIPDTRRIFLPEDFPAGIYPWRKDETGVPEEMVKQLWQVGRPQEMIDDLKPKPKPAPKPEPASEPAPAPTDTSDQSDKSDNPEPSPPQPGGA
jgi:membrane-bound hydrogenase subunit beta